MLNYLDKQTRAIKAKLKVYVLFWVSIKRILSSHFGLTSLNDSAVFVNKCA